MIHRKEAALKERIAAHFSSSGSLENQLMAWQKKLSQEGQEFPLLPDIPTVRDVLAWLGVVQEPIEIVHFHYGLVQYPRAGDKAGDKILPYQVKIDLEFTAPNPAVAHRFQEALEKVPTLVDKKQKVAWTAQQDSYKLSFVLRKI
jgi:type IV pilus assembly protein PilM